MPGEWQEAGEEEPHPTNDPGKPGQLGRPGRRAWPGGWVVSGYALTSVIFIRKRWFSDCSPSRRDVLAWFTLVTDVEVLESSFFWFCVNWNLLF